MTCETTSFSLFQSS